MVGFPPGEAGKYRLGQQDEDYHFGDAETVALVTSLMSNSPGSDSCPDLAMAEHFKVAQLKGSS
ncbi:MAG: hypothetical protein NZ899_07675 [Thermoguttaceae bacterium]|nr:hypothetical protein [Thermoguttaceae bacterium]MDW8079021.1 hypothetical protein [Thermoguttaceae bacterium]